MFVVHRCDSLQRDPVAESCVGVPVTFTFWQETLRCSSGVSARVHGTITSHCCSICSTDPAGYHGKKTQIVTFKRLNVLVLLPGLDLRLES